MNIYNLPKIGIFRVETGDYDPLVGWVQKEEKIKIIGEDTQTYISRTQPLNYGIYENGVVKQINTVIGIGPHKTRLVRWIETQLELEF
jgi:hypothetical protein